MKIERIATAQANIIILALHGKLLIDDGTETLQETILGLPRSAQRQAVILDLGEVPYVDSSGLGEIVRSWTMMSRQGNKLALCNLTRKIKDLLTITKFLTILEIYDTREEAIAELTKKL